MIDMSNTSTNTTTPVIIWMHEVICLAGCSVEDMEQMCGRDRVLRWYGAGEPVWMAADSLRAFVTNGKRHDRAERETSYLTHTIKESIK